MRDIFTVAKFTITDMVRRKSFIVSTIIILCGIVIGFNIPNIKDALSGENTLDKSYVVDSENVFNGMLTYLNDMDLGYEFIIENKEVSDEDIKKKIEDGEVSEAIVIKTVDGNVSIDYVVDNGALLYGNVPYQLQSVFNQLYYEANVSKLNLTEEEYNMIHSEITYNIVETSDTEVKGDPISIMLISIVLFFMIYLFAFQVSSSITLEKTSKIIETLVTSTTPKNIVLGKTLGVGLVGIAEFILFIIVAVISKILFLKEGAFDSFVDFSTFTPMLGIITLIYFILGYAVFSLLYALVGSTVSKPEDVQQVNGPVGMISMIGFYLAYFSMMNPTSSINKLAGILPISSPFCMPFRVMMDVATPLEVILSIIVLLVTSIIIAYVSIRIYSNAILNNGTRAGLRDLVKIFKSND